MITCTHLDCAPCRTECIKGKRSTCESRGQILAPCDVTGVLWADTFNTVVKSAVALKLDNGRFDGECKA